MDYNIFHGLKSVVFTFKQNLLSASPRKKEDIVNAWISSRSKLRGFLEAINKLGKTFALLLATCYLLLHSILPVSAQSPTPTGQPVSDVVRDKVREKIENLTKKPRAKVGTLLDVTDSALEISTKKENIVQVAVKEDTTYARVARGRRSDIAFEDLVLGDFIIVMGFVNSDEILEAERVVSFSEDPIVERRAVFGIVQENDGGTLLVQHPKTLKTWKVDTSNKTEIKKKGERVLPAAGGGELEVSVADIEPGDRIIAAGVLHEEDEEIIVAGRIFVLSKTRQSLTP